ncbi:DUF6221 family protein [Parafrankia soli]|uniref:DUF6221 family protein n=1 Tax=Parafrankia soli TaxID=2599596 RepID=UPI001042567A|nr:DUF6221 family protein [Parafrankia soli]
MTTDIAAFILERLDDEERDARAATPGPWRVGNFPRERVVYSGPDEADVLIYDEGGHSEADAHHVARQDPAATVARVEALRALVEVMELSANDGDCNVDAVGEEALRHVAAIWRHHEGYDERWTR